MDHPTECQCSGPGYCSLMQREMGNARWNECKNKPHYFEMFLSEVGRKRASPKPARPPLGPCVHLGKENGRIECPACRGTVKIKTFACDVHGKCTLGKSLDDVACCVGCDEFSPNQDVPFNGPGSR